MKKRRGITSPFFYNKDINKDKIHNEEIVDAIVNLIIDIMENKLLRKYVIKK